MTQIVYLANARIPTPRAYGLQIVKTCEAFAVHGAEVELVTPTRHTTITADAYTYYGVQKNFKLTQVATPDYVRFGSLGFLISAIWFSEKARWLRSFWSADVVYSRDALVLIQYVLLGRPLVFEAHAAPTFISAFVARHARCVVVISHGLKVAYGKAGVKSEKIRVAPDAVDEHLFATAPARTEARAMLGFAADARIALYAGHLYERKGAGVLAASAALQPETQFIFIGGAGPELAQFKQKWGSVANIRILGHVPHEQVPQYLRAADVLVLPNSGNNADSARYTSPMKLFEYMASGTPIVASDVPAIREVLDTNTACLVYPDDSDALARGIQETLSLGELAIARAEKARMSIESFTWRKRAEAILAFVAGHRYHA